MTHGTDATNIKEIKATRRFFASKLSSVGDGPGFHS